MTTNEDPGTATELALDLINSTRRVRDERGAKLQGHDAIMTEAQVLAILGVVEAFGALQRSVALQTHVLARIAKALETPPPD